MPLLRNILTFALALLLVNPACCCAQGGCCSPVKEPVRSCCSSSPANQESDQNRDNGHTCMCSLNKEYPDFKAFHFQATDLTCPQGPPPTLQNPGHQLGPCYVIVASSVHPPPGHSLCILYSTFRL